MNIFDRRTWGLDGDRAGDWRDRAACGPGSGIDPELFFPVGTGRLAEVQSAQAVAVCRRCPVLADCRRYVTQIRPGYGVWAGTTHWRRRWCQWCEQPFEYENEFPRSRICTPCAVGEQFGSLDGLRGELDVRKVVRR